MRNIFSPKMILSPPLIPVLLSLALTPPLPPLGLHNNLLTECPPVLSCIISQDDIPTSFLEPWEYDEPLSVLLPRLLKQVTQDIPTAQLIVQQARYIRFQIPVRGDVVDDLEFFFPDDDRIVHFRSARRGGAFDWWENRMRLNRLRMKLGLVQIPVLRNRIGRLGVFETPFDRFGPTAVDVDSIIERGGPGSRPVR